MRIKSVQQCETVDKKIYLEDYDLLMHERIHLHDNFKNEAI